MAQENDIVLIYFEDNPLMFARIEDISPDVKRDWYHVKLLLLQIPLQVVTWILRDVYINGEEFTMNGKKMRMEEVICPEQPEIPEPSQEEEEAPKNSGDAKVISLTNRKKN
ncbi:hypothetical protein [Desulfonema magnum]|uniref:Uncharacterized protein n=1 Tax=Desulfonema magnum TaxID=45655 RepID=A0A975BNW3_9BACT|nr:hypothetical protein [Desulfonema magnum]QTA88926.1 Uncharacterized protein dnm_049730 [Desulfonema magnum]